MRTARAREALVAGAVGLVAFLPFLRGALAGASLYFRDLGIGFLPMRRLALDGLGRGEVPLWNPYVHEGAPLSLPALGYLPDLLQLLRPDEAGISLVLALHVPLAALGFYLLARLLFELPPVAAAGGALVYSLGGFVLSTVNLYVLVQAAAWAPLVVLGLARAATGGRRAVAASAVVLAIALTTTGVEIVGQAVVAGAVLGLDRTRFTARLGRLGAAFVLGAALAAPALVLVGGQVGTSARGAGFATEVVLSHSVHPFTLVQTLVGGLYGNLASLADEWWGQNFFPRGFPYILSLYLGPAALALAVTGALDSGPRRRRVVALAGVGLVLSLGGFAGLAPLVDALDLRLFRYPVKAFFTVHLAVALLASRGLAGLAAGDSRRASSRLAVAAGMLGGLLVLLRLVPRLAPEAAASFAASFFPAGLGAAARADLLERVVSDAATGGALALAVAAVAALARGGVLVPARAAVLVPGLLGGDLLRTGSGLNPMVTASFFQPSPPLAERLDELRDRRVFTCPFEASGAYLEARRERGARHEVWTFGVALETLIPAFNVPLRVPTAMSPDLTMLVPEDRVLPATGPACRDLDRLVPRLRRAGVDTVLSLDPLEHPALVAADAWRPRRIAPLVVRQYHLSSPLPRVGVASSVVPVPTAAAAVARAAEPGFLTSGAAFVEGHEAVDGARGRVVRAVFAGSSVTIEAETDRATVLVVRDGWADGWTASVDGRPAPVLRVDGRHRGIPLPAGSHAVELRYRPRAVLGALGVFAVGLAATLWLARGRHARGPEEST